MRGPGLRHPAPFGQRLAAQPPAAAAVTFTDAPSYSNSSTGTLVEAKTGADSQTGASSATGALVDGRIGANAATGSSSATSSISETRTAVNTVSGVSSSSSTLTDVHSVTFTDAPAGASTSSASRVEGRTGGDSGSGTSASTYALAEARTAGDVLNYTAAAVETLIVVTGLADAPSGLATSTGALTDAYSSPSSPALSTDTSGLPGLVELITRRRPLRPAAAPVYDDRPTGVSHATHELAERHTVAAPAATYARRALRPQLRPGRVVAVVHDDPNIEELVALGIL